MTGGTGREAATAVAVPPGASETLTGPGIVELLRDAAAADPARVYCEWGDEEITFADLDERSDDVARGLAALGLRAGDVVCTMLKNHPDHVLVFFALLKLGVVWVPLNTHLRGASLTHIWTETRCSALVYDGECDAQVEPLFESHRPWLRVRRRSGGPPAVAARAFDDVVALGRREPALAPAESSDRTICISYTSGTTGRPKGVLLTDRMLRTCAVGVGVVTQPEPGDVFLVWEPLHHIGGSQMLLVPLLAPVRLVLVERFSASRFWPLARARGVTHVHYLGGILQILLKQPAAADDADNPVRVAWGGGCPAETWEAFERRFGVVVREDFGLTETSSIVTVNLEGKVGSVGRVLPWFDVRVVDEDGRDAPPGVTGEILVGERIPGLLTRGYFQNEDATRALLRDGWLHTGDLGHLDEEGHLWFGGRKKDSVRRRGENVSAWEVESVVNQHPDVEESALVGVATDVGEEDLKLFVKPRAGAALHPQVLVEWCEARMAYFQVPRYVAFVDAFPKTPTERIRKEELSRVTSGCWDREAERRTSEAAR